MAIDKNKIIKEYRDLLSTDDPFYIFEGEDGSFLGFDIKTDGDEDEVIVVIKENNIDNIGEKYPNSVRIGSVETTPYDFGILGYVEYGDGNARIVYSYERICESLVKDDDIPYEDAVDWVEYNTIRSLPYITENVRPYIIYETI